MKFEWKRCDGCPEKGPFFWDLWIDGVESEDYSISTVSGKSYDATYIHDFHDEVVVRTETWAEAAQWCIEHYQSRQRMAQDALDMLPKVEKP